MVLRGTYGEKIHRTYQITRQGVRWRFQRVFGDIYVSAFETILAIETILGTRLRDHAIRISRERYKLRQQELRRGLGGHTAAVNDQASKSDQAASHARRAHTRPEPR